MLDPVDLFLEATLLFIDSKFCGVDSLFSCQFESRNQTVLLFEQIFGNQDWEIVFLMVCSLHLCPGQPINQRHRFPTIWLPYVHSLDWISLVDEVSDFNNRWVPGIEFRLRRNATLGTVMLRHG